MADAEGIHHLLAGLLLVIEDERHDGLHAILERGIGRACQLLVVLDEVDVRRDQLPDEGRSLVRPQPQRRLDDGADDGPALHATEPAAAADAELRPRMRAAELFGQVHRGDADAGEAADGPDAAHGDGHQLGEVGADGIEGEVDIGLGAVEGAGAVGWEGGPCGGRQRVHRHDACRNPGLQLLGLAGHGDEGAGRLVGGDFGRKFFGTSFRFNEIGETDHVGRHIAHGRLTGMMT